ncbi:MAG: monovalent cation/H(+) antiporter subunit G [Blastochloris sp.]|nr:monovalent cation/H(+) antiporter subunit G [Blastochloris sp.]
MITSLLTATLLLSGAFFILLAAIGLIRLPDIYCRSHAIGKAMTLGISSLLLALLVDLGLAQTGLKVVLAICFQFLTIPIGSHLLCLIARQHEVPRWTHKK